MSIKFKNIDYKDSNNITFDFVTPVNRDSRANTLRRALISEIEVWAIDEVIFIENKTNVTTDYITKRLHDIPIYQNKDINFESLTFSLNVKGTKASGTTIFTKDLISSDNARYFQDDIELIILQKDASLNFTTHLGKGTGLVHEKYSPVVSPGFKPTNPDTIHFTLCSLGQFDCKTLLKLAVERITSRCEALYRAIQNENVQKVQVSKIFDNKYEYLFLDETCTIANLIAKELILDTDNIISAGYRKEHMASDDIIISVCFRNEVDLKSANNIVLKTIGKPIWKNV